jgi:O-succinylbenzoic acid--CoA ligase
MRSFAWESKENALLLNPRLGAVERARFEEAWRTHVESRFEGQVGIATSGSSGEGHGRVILLSKNALLTSAQAVNWHLHASASDVWMKTLPDFHVGGFGILARAHLNGARIVESRLVKWEPAAFHAELNEARATLLSLVPTQLHDLVAQGLASPKELRAVVIGGARLSTGLYERARRLRWPVLPSYGLTECCSQVATAGLESLDETPAPSSAIESKALPPIKPLTHVKVRIGANDAIEIASPALLTGQLVFDSQGHACYKDPKIHDSNAKADGPAARGWLRTEDRGRIEGDGSLTVLGRTIDFVKIGGEGVLLSRLEEVFERVRLEAGFRGEAVVLVAHDERLGARIVLVTEREESAVEPLIAAFNERVMPFERIRETRRLAKMPRSAIGKLLRFEALAAVGFKPVEHL